MAWSRGHRIRNNRGARVSTHRLDPPVPVTARIAWEDDGEESIDTNAAGWRGQNVYVRLPGHPVAAHVGVARHGGRQAALTWP
jgi:hypothetical protein